MEQRWRIELLGQLRACRGDEHVVPFQIQKSGALLAYLAYHTHHPAARHLLIERLWPEDDPEEGRRKLRSLLYPLRQLLPSEASPGGSLLIAERATLCLDPAAFTTDVAEFRAALQAAATAAEPARRLEALSTAVGLYGGELLPGYYEEWVLTERQALAEQYLKALGQLLAGREAAGDLAGALAAARQVVTADPLREEAHYDVMRLAAALGRPSAALRQYQELTRVLQEELGETPSAEARALAEELRSSGRTLVVARSSGFGDSEPPAAPTASPPEERPEPEPVPAAPAPREAPLPEVALPEQLTRFFGREEEIARLCSMLGSNHHGDTETRRRGTTGEDQGVGLPPHSVSKPQIPLHPSSVSPCLRGDSARLVTVTGPGGSGKTRLAIAVAGRLRAAWEGRVAFVPLADVTEGRRIPDAIAEVLGLPRSAEEPPLAQVITHLRAAPWLLVLDNLEHLVEEGALLVRQLLERVPSLVCLATSRQRLVIAGEQEFALLPLATPRGKGVEGRVWGVGSGEEKPVVGRPYTLHPTPDTLLSFPSVQLFVDRARAVRADFELTEGNAAAVAELCDRLEGLPLAIELAAARIGVLSPAEMLAQLGARFQFLVSRQRDLPGRHRSLRAAIESSYQLLDPELQRFFARLSVFRGGWTREAAQAICADFRPQMITDEHGWRKNSKERPSKASALRHPEASSPSASSYLRPSVSICGPTIQYALDCLEQLRECSLVLAEEGVEGTRYRLLETLREYAWEQLAAAGELAAARQRHYDWYLQVALKSDGAASEPERQECWARLEAEIDNVRAALAWCLEEADADAEGDGAAAGLRLVAASWWLWHARGHIPEGRRWLEGALDRGRHLPPAVRALALAQTSHLCSVVGQRDRSRSFLQAARREYEALLVTVRREGEPAEVARMVLSLSQVTSDLDDLEAAWEFSAEARQLFEELQEPVHVASALYSMASVALRRRDRQSARALLDERLAICRKLDIPGLSLIHALGGLGHLERDEGNYARAGALYRESLLLRREFGAPLALAQSLEDLAGLASRQQQHERAIRLLGATEAFSETLGARLPVAVREEYERTVAEGRATLGEPAFEAAWAEGRAMSLDQAVAYALGEG